MIALTFCVATQTLTLEQSFSSFSSGVVWLILLAFFLALGFKRTGLGTRIAYSFISLLGRNALGLSYGFVATEFFLAPLVPSNTARGAGIIFPVASALAQEQGGHSKAGRSVGAFLMQVCFQANMITSAMFLTGLVGNPLIASLAGVADVKIDWFTWALAALVPGVMNLLIMPLALHHLYPPQMTNPQEARQKAQQKLKELGPLTLHEKLMVTIFAGIMVLWVVGERYGISPTAAALIGFSLLLFFGIVKWKDCIHETTAWETLIWFAPLLMMATFLTKFGVMGWFTDRMSTHVGTLSWPIAFALLSLVYFYTHYLFASVTARITALYSAFLLVMVAVGTPPMLAAMTLAVFSSLAGTLTHFGTGTAPVYFGAGYMSVPEWWQCSFKMSLVNLATWILFAGIWWKILGYW